MNLDELRQKMASDATKENEQLKSEVNLQLSNAIKSGRNGEGETLMAGFISSLSLSG